MASLHTVRFTLGNGLRVMLWPHGTSSLVHGRLVIDAGRADDPSGSEGVADLVGTGALEDQLVYRSRQLSTRVDDAIGSLSARLRMPTFNISDDKKKIVKATLRQARGLARRDYERKLAAAVYGDSHPYARPLVNEDSLDTIHTDLVTRWARDHVVARNATVVLTGQFDPELAKKYIAYDMDQVSAGTPTVPHAVTVDRPAKMRVFGTTKQAGPSIELDVLFAGGRGVDAEHAQRLVLADVITARLQRMRGEKGITYGMHVDFEPRVLGGLWRISGKADAARAGEATKLLLQILDDMRKDPESYRADFVLARQKVLERIEVGANDSGAMADQLAMFARFNLDDSFVTNVAGDVAKLTLKDLHAFFRKELAADHQVFGAFGDPASVGAAETAAE